MSMERPFLSSASSRPPAEAYHRPRRLVVPSAIYLGFEVEYNNETHRAEYAICAHDGSYTVDYELETIDMQGVSDPKEKITEHVLRHIVQYARSQNYKIQAIGLGIHKSTKTIDGFDLHRIVGSLAPRLWFDFDAVPFVISTKGLTVDERASSAVRKAVVWMGPQIPSIPRISVGFRHEVEVDLNGMIRLCDLSHQKETVKAETWQVLVNLAAELRRKKVRATFFNSTPQGGGVALMRHALIRLCRLLDLDVHWYCAKPKPDIFDITKRKFHNVLQGVSTPGVKLSEADMQSFIEWSKYNADRFWSDAGGPIRTSDVIVIDDPQVCGIIPIIKKLNPSCKIIYRSHIEVRSDLIRADSNSPQAITWNFLKTFISQADLFVSHPIAGFVPDDVPKEKVVLLGASTDALDGLNKPMKDEDIDYYRLVFNRLSSDQGGVEIDFSRPYIAQVARFDPSKGIPHVLESFRILREKMQAADRPLPSLIICGTSSIDDPDGIIVYEQTVEQLAQPEFNSIAKDIAVVRLPPSDQLFNAIVRKARVVLQLSTREGFEIKVTEALHKGVPVVAFRAGGIPIQIDDGKTGYLVDIGDVESVAQHLYNLCIDDDLYERISNAARETINEEFFNVYQTLNWLYMINHFADAHRRDTGQSTFDDGVDIGHCRWIKEFWQEEYAKGRFHGKRDNTIETKPYSPPTSPTSPSTSDSQPVQPF